MKVFLLTVDAAMDENDGGQYYQITTLRFSSGEYNKDGLDWEPRLKQPSLFVKGASTGNILPSSVSSSFGETVLVNPDGGLDYLANYALDGRELLIQVYDDELDTLTDVVKTTVSAVSFSKSEVSFTLRDLYESLSQEHPQEVYAGDNILPDGVEGVADDIKGTSKPKVFGDVRNASPYMVNSAKLIYQVSSNPCSVKAVYDRGVELVRGDDCTSLAQLEALTDSDIPVGINYRSYQGYFKLRSSPSGVITCDAESPNKLLGDIFETIVTEAGYTPCPTCKATLNTRGVGGIFLKDATNTNELLDKIADSSLSYWTLNDAGILIMETIRIPLQSEPSTLLQDYQLLDLTRSSLGGGENGVPVYRYVVEYDKIETTQNDLAGSVSDARKARMVNQYREWIASNDSQKALRNLLSEEKVITTILRDGTSALNLSGMYLDLLSKRRDTVEAKVRLEDALGLKIGSAVKVESRYLGYSSGRMLAVVGMTINIRKQEVTLNLFG